MNPYQLIASQKAIAKHLASINACGKVRFKRLQKAQSAASHLKLAVYKCRKCKGWHLTSHGLKETVFGVKR